MIYNVGIYARLSREDKGSGIENQISMLTKFVRMMPNWVITRTYIDDGVSGATFNRRGFRDMMEDVRNGIINLVLVKDLSRFGRNYLEAGRYLEEELPTLGCRFVAIGDNIDTEKGESDIIPFLNAINDFYVRDVSRRIKSVNRARAQDGQWLTGIPPYGYERSQTERGRLVIDSYVASIVRQMFEMRAAGMGYTAIAGALNKQSVPPPRLHYFQKQRRATSSHCAAIWTSRTVKLILQKEVYAGHMVSLKSSTRSHRDKRRVWHDERDWIRVENTHPPIVSQKLWDKVQAINQASKKFCSNNQPHASLFAGLLICSDCGAKMGVHHRTNYQCSTYERSGRAACSTHHITENTLKSLVCEHIKDKSRQITLDENAMLAKLTAMKKDSLAIIANQRRRLEREIRLLEVQMEQVFENKVAGSVTVEQFSTDITKLDGQHSVLKNRLELLEQASTETNWKSLVKQKSTHIEVDRELLVMLIERIIVGARKDSTQTIEIIYRYEGKS